MSGISPLASVDPAAVIGEDVTIGPFTLVHPGVELGAGSTVGSHCVLGEPGPDGGGPLKIGDGATIRSHSVLYAGSEFGPRLETGHRVTMREGLKVGENLRVGTLGDLQGDATIGDFVRFHSNVHVGKHTTIGDFVWVFPYVVFTNDPHPPSVTQLGCVVEDFAVIGTMVVVLPGVRVGRDAVVSAGALVTRNVEAGQLAMGSPAKPRRPASDIQHSDGSGSAYPWRRHYGVGYPEDVVAQWRRASEG